MEINLKSRQEIEDFFATEILGSVETRELLDVNRARLAQLKDSGRLKPIKSLARENLFLKADVMKLKEELAASRKQFKTKK